MALDAVARHGAGYGRYGPLGSVRLHPGERLKPVQSTSASVFMQGARPVRDRHGNPVREFCGTVAGLIGDWMKMSVWSWDAPKELPCAVSCRTGFRESETTEQLQDATDTDAFSSFE